MINNQLIYFLQGICQGCPHTSWSPINTEFNLDLALSIMLLLEGSHTVHPPRFIAGLQECIIGLLGLQVIRVLLHFKGFYYSIIYQIFSN